MKKAKTIGIIGGVGPYAGLDLCRKIMDNTIAKTDYDHLPLVLLSDPLLVPNRTEYITGKSNINPAYGIIDGFKKLKKSGAEVVAIACNAAHSRQIFDIVTDWNNKEGNLTIVSIIDETVSALKRSKRIHSVAMLSVTGTYHSKVYENALSDAQFSVTDLSSSLKKKVHDLIWSSQYGIKAFSDPVKPEVKIEFENIINELSRKKIDAVVLACTEIPLAVDTSKKYQSLIIDPTNILARALIRESNPEKLLNPDQIF